MAGIGFGACFVAGCFPCFRFLSKGGPDDDAWKEIKVNWRTGEKDRGRLYLIRVLRIGSAPAENK